MLHPEKIRNGNNGPAYSGAHLAGGAKIHPRGYKLPAPRKCDGTMLWRAAGAAESTRIELPAHLRADAGKGERKAMPKIHPDGYHMAKPRKDDGTMLVRLNGPDAPATRIPTPDNFRVVYFPRLEREKLSEEVEEQAWAMYYDAPLEMQGAA